jgi:hypothetical protein
MGSYNELRLLFNDIYSNNAIPGDVSKYPNVLLKMNAFKHEKH